jgi:hypothetical protein
MTVLKKNKNKKKVRIKGRRSLAWWSFQQAQAFIKKKISYAALYSTQQRADVQFNSLLPEISIQIVYVHQRLFFSFNFLFFSQVSP